MSNKAVLFFFPEDTQEPTVVTDKDGRPLLFRDTAAALMWAYRQPSVHGDGWQAYDIGPVSDDATTDQIMCALDATSIVRAKPSLRGSWADMAGRWPADSPVKCPTCKGLGVVEHEG